VFSTAIFKAPDTAFMGKFQPRVIIYSFSLKGWAARKIQKELTDTLGSDVYSQAQTSRWLARFSMVDISCLDQAQPGRLLSILGPSQEHFLEKFPFASARIIAGQFNVSHSTVKDILSQELRLRKFSRRWISYQRSKPQKKFRVDTSVEFIVLLDQYSELQFEGIAINDESWACRPIESDSMLARRREEVIPGLRLGISIKKL
jgi:hypothetical protein